MLPASFDSVASRPVDSAANRREPLALAREPVASPLHPLAREPVAAPGQDALAPRACSPLPPAPSTRSASPQGCQSPGNWLSNLESLSQVELLVAEQAPTLVLFDLDSTLVQPPAAGLYSRHWFELAEGQRDGMGVVTPEMVAQAKELLVSKHFVERFPTTACEPAATAALFAYLAARGVNTCGFTARPTRWIDCTAAQVQNLGVTWTSDAEPWAHADHPKHAGVYFVTDERKTPKGAVLPAVLAHELGAEWRRHRVFFVDDKLENLEGSMAAAQRAGYSRLTALHYAPHLASSVIDEGASLALIRRQILAGLTPGAAIPGA